jgi:hypothetical protein
MPCLIHTHILSHDQGQAPYSSSVVVDQQRRRVYWIYVELTAAGKPFIGAANLDTGAPLNPATPNSWVWIARSTQV